MLRRYSKIPTYRYVILSANISSDQNTLQRVEVTKSLPEVPSTPTTAETVPLTVSSVRTPSLPSTTTATNATSSECPLLVSQLLQKLGDYLRWRLWPERAVVLLSWDIERLRALLWLDEVPRDHSQLSSILWQSTMHLQGMRDIHMQVFQVWPLLFFRRVSFAWQTTRRRVFLSISATRRLAE